jgi:hypothetical protein
VSVVREIIVNTFVSLDGVMQAPGGPVLAEYRTGATIEPGSFAPDEPSEAELERRAKLEG